MPSDLQWIIDRLRGSGLVPPTFAAPVGIEPPPELKSDRRDVTRRVGGHSVTVTPSDNEVGGGV